MPTGLCFYCNREVDMKVLKRCGACRAVTYCSKDCQKQGWNLIHKYNCVPSSIPAKEQALMKPRTKIISAWQNRWRNTLDAFSVLALDLENNPGKNATHCMWLEFKYTGSGGDSEKFRFIGGAIRTTDDVLVRAPELRLMRDSPSLIGKQIRYVTVFHFAEGSKPLQSFVRARSLVLANGLEPFKGQPAGWATVFVAVQQMFGPTDGGVVVLDIPAE